MAIRTTWTVTHACGHDQDHDLSNKRPSARASYAKWLATKQCSTCWRTERDQRADKEKEAWLTKRRAEEHEAIETWERRFSMPAMDGSDKAVSWARQVRYELISAGAAQAEARGEDAEEYLGALEGALGTVTSASWWIDQRDTEADDIAELVVDAAADPAVDTGTKNPF
jgi:hypothetical protein